MYATYHNKTNIFEGLKKTTHLPEFKIKNVFKDTVFSRNPREATVSHQGLRKLLDNAVKEGHIEEDDVDDIYKGIRKTTQEEWDRHPELYVSKTQQKLLERLDKLRARGLIGGKDPEKAKSASERLRELREARSEARKRKNVQERKHEYMVEDRLKADQKDREAEEKKLKDDQERKEVDDYHPPLDLQI
jgi:hypothetical protein